jgi:hypothetical protein
MGKYQAFIALQLQATLRQSSQLFVADVLAFRSLLADYGLDATTVPKYCLTGSIKFDAAGQEISRKIELKVLGVWTPFIVETRAFDTFVLHA